MKDLAMMYGLDLGDTYELGARLLITLEPEIEYTPADEDQLVEIFLEKCADYDSDSDSDRADVCSPSSPSPSESEDPSTE